MDSLITQTMSTLGLLGVGVLMFLENVFPPIPSELIMPLAGYAAARGDMSLVGVVVAGTIGSVLGQFPLYYLGRAVGERRLHDLANRYGKWITVSGAEVTRAGEWLRRRGTLAVFCCRLIPGLRSLISIPAGASGMNLMLFTSCSTLGIALWSTLLASLGYLLGRKLPPRRGNHRPLQPAHLDHPRRSNPRLDRLANPRLLRPRPGRLPVQRKFIARAVSVVDPAGQPENHATPATISKTIPRNLKSTRRKQAMLNGTANRCKQIPTSASLP